jgi:UDP-N-acetylglucosamine:LPS N-acetylglucosamine transferase
VAFAGSGLRREVLTGNPVRAEVRSVDATGAGRRQARATLGLPTDRRLLVVTGGSLGARRINRAAIDLVRGWADRSDVAVYHVIGARDWPAESARLPASREGGLDYRAVEYEQHMPLVLAAADLVVARAGGTTLAELTVLGRPSLLVPLPIAPDDHQMVGARRLEAEGAAVVIPDRELTGDRLAREVGALFGAPDRLAAMASAAARLGRPDAAERVADVVEASARG